MNIYGDGLIRAQFAGFKKDVTEAMGGFLRELHRPAPARADAMAGFLLRRVGAALIVLLLSSMLVFLGVRALPGDPATALGAENRDPAVMAAIRHHYGLDQPVPVQYAKWLGLAVQGDLGRDQRDLPSPRRSSHRLPITLELAFLSIMVGIMIGIPAGIIAAVRQRKACGLRRDERGPRRAERPALLARADDDQLLRRRARTGSRRRSTSRSREDPIENLST